MTAVTAADVLPPLPKCRRCWHPADEHRLDDATNVSPVDPAAEFRCIHGTPLFPGNRCTCPDYIRKEGAR